MEADFCHCTHAVFYCFPIQFFNPKLWKWTFQAMSPQLSSPNEGLVSFLMSDLPVCRLTFAIAHMQFFTAVLYICLIQICGNELFKQCPLNNATPMWECSQPLIVWSACVQADFCHCPHAVFYCFPVHLYSLKLCRWTFQAMSPQLSNPNEGIVSFLMSDFPVWRRTFVIAHMQFFTAFPYICTVWSCANEHFKQCHLN